MANNKVDSAMFRRDAFAAIASVFAFAEFVKKTENIFDSDVNGDFVRSYKDAWFKLEVINAVALEEWEADGRPSDWAEKWESKYRKNASEVIGELVQLVDDRE